MSNSEKSIIDNMTRDMMRKFSEYTQVDRTNDVAVLLTGTDYKTAFDKLQIAKALIFGKVGTIKQRADILNMLAAPPVA